MRIFFAFAALALPLAACSVEQTEEGEMPDVDIDADAGSLPEYDVDTPDVEVGTTEETVEVPTISVEPAGDDNQ